MRKQISMVEEFHKAFGVPVAQSPTLPPEERLKLRCKLILEEALEFIEAAGFTVDVVDSDGTYHITWKADRPVNFIGMCDAIADLKYVTFGTEVEMGLKEYSEPMFAEVHSSNMSKLGEDGKPVYREDGKVKKGPNYYPPNLEKVLKAPTTAPAEGAAHQGRPFSFSAIATTPYKLSPETGHLEVRNEHNDLVLDNDTEAEWAKEIAYRINAFEPAPGDVGEAGGDKA